MSQTITFKDGTALPYLAVCSDTRVIQGAYRAFFEIRIPIEATTYDELSALAANPENLSEITLTEEVNEITNQTSTYYNFTIITGIGQITDPVDGTQYFFLYVAQKSDSELAIERILQENEAMKDAIFELAGIVADVAGEEE